MTGNYFTYIISNPEKIVLYIGMTNDIHRRLIEHHENKGNNQTFAGRYFCHKLVWYERHNSAEHAIAREKEIKKWSRIKKERLIKTINPAFDFLNPQVLDFG